MHSYGTYSTHNFVTLSGWHSEGCKYSKQREHTASMHLHNNRYSICVRCLKTIQNQFANVHLKTTNPLLQISAQL